MKPTTIEENGSTHYLCFSCNSYFEEHTGGMKVDGEEEYYCPDCISRSQHIATIRDYCSNCDEPTKTANQIIQELKYV